jgi:hypothetical protein
VFPAPTLFPGISLLHGAKGLMTTQLSCSLHLSWSRHCYSY